MTDGRGDIPAGFKDSELDRRVDGLVRIGVVEQVQLSPPRVRVRVDGTLSGWLRVGQARAGKVRTWSPLSTGEQVSVMCPSGNTADGFVMGSFPRDAFPPSETSGDVYSTVWDDGTKQEYNAATQEMVTTVGESVVKQSADKIELILGGISFLLSSSGVTIVGDVTVTGSLTVSGDATAGGVSTMHHRHTGVQAGVARTGEPG